MHSYVSHKHSTVTDVLLYKISFLVLHCVFPQLSFSILPLDPCVPSAYSHKYIQKYPVQRYQWQDVPTLVLTKIIHNSQPKISPYRRYGVAVFDNPVQQSFVTAINQLGSFRSSFFIEISIVYDSYYNATTAANCLCIFFCPCRH